MRCIKDGVNILNKLIKVLASSITGRLFILVFMLYLSKVLPSKEYGDLMLMYGTMMSYTWLFTIGLPVYLVPQFKRSNDANCLFKQSLIITIFTSSLGSIILFFQFLIFMDTELHVLSILFVSISVMPNALIRIFGAKLQSQGKISRSSFYQFFIRNFSILATSFLIFEVTRSTLSMTFGILVSHLLVLYLYNKDEKIFKLNLFVNVIENTNFEFLRPCLKILISGFSFQLIFILPGWLSNGNVPDVEYAYIVTLQSILAQGFMLLSSLSSVVYPDFIKTLRNSLHMKNKVIFNKVFVINLMYVVFFILFWRVIYDVVFPLFNSDFGIYASNFYVAALGLLIYFLKGPINTYFAAQGSFHWEAITFTFGLMIFILFMLYRQSITAENIATAFALTFIVISIMEMFLMFVLLDNVYMSKVYVFMTMSSIAYILYIVASAIQLESLNL